MFRRYLLLIISVLSFGCTNYKENNKGVPLIEVSPTEFTRDELLSNVAASIKIIPLQKSENIFFGNIEHIKVSGNYICLLDSNQTKSITVFDSQGNYISQLKKLGQGPGEYPDIYSFSFYENEIYIYSRGKKAFLVYSFPEMNFVEEIGVDRYINNFESIGDRLLCFNESSEQLAYGVSYFSPLSNSFEETDLPNTPATIELAYPNTIVKLSDKELNYASQGEYTTIYKITDTNITPCFNIDFGSNKIPSKYWNESIAEAFESAFEEGPPKATWVQNPIITESYLSFYYVFANPKAKQLAIYNRKSDNTKVYYQLCLEKKYQPIPYPIGVYKDYYVSLIYAEEIDDLLPSDLSLLDTSWKEKIRENDEEGKVLLLLFKI